MKINGFPLVFKAKLWNSHWTRKLWGTFGPKTLCFQCKLHGCPLKTGAKQWFFNFDVLFLFFFQETSEPVEKGLGQGWALTADKAGWSLAVCRPEPWTSLGKPARNGQAPAGLVSSQGSALAQALFHRLRSFLKQKKRCLNLKIMVFHTCLKENHHIYTDNITCLDQKCPRAYVFSVIFMILLSKPVENHWFSILIVFFVCCFFGKLLRLWKKTKKGYPLATC